MIPQKEYLILAFETTTDAMQAEQCLKKHFSIAIMPVPREISSGCGLAIRFPEPDEAAIVDFLNTSSITGTLYRMSTTKLDGKHPIRQLYTFNR